MKYILLIFIAAFCLALYQQAHAKKTYGNLDIKEVVEVYDGDTIKVNLPHLHPIIGDTISVRINGLDTPEKGWRGKCAKEKTKAERARTSLKVTLENAKKIELENRTFDNDY